MDERDHIAITSMRVIRERVAARVIDAAHTTTSEFVDAPAAGRAAVAIPAPRQHGRSAGPRHSARRASG